MANDPQDVIEVTLDMVHVSKGMVNVPKCMYTCPSCYGNLPQDMIHVSQRHGQIIHEYEICYIHCRTLLKSIWAL
jgi:hypothetical protein